MSANPPPAGRLAWIDQLRTLAIVLVVNMHACVTYSHVGSWYVSDGPDPEPVKKLLFLIWQGHLQAFFMGILFLLAGYFAHRSLERRGTAPFLRERLLRLGLPALVYMVALHPLIRYVINPNRDEFIPHAYFWYLVDFRFLSGSGPMWFALALLIFCAVLAAWRRLVPPAAPAGRPTGAVPRSGAVAAWAGVLVLSTFLIRTVQPIGTSVLNMQLCYFPQYVMAFAAGVAAARNDWLQALARSRLARRAGWTALFLGPVALVGVLVAGGILKGADLQAFAGGWRLQSLGLSAWEQLAGFGLGLGALAFCSGKLARVTPLSEWLSRRSFGVYFLHAPVLVLFTVILRPWGIDPFFKVSILTAAGLAVSFALSEVASRIPGLRAIV